VTKISIITTEGNPKFCKIKIDFKETYTLLSVYDIVSSVRASLDRLWSSLSCADTGAYETWYGFVSLDLIPG